VAVAVVDFLYGPPASDPYRVGTPLGFELDGYWSPRRGQYRVTYSIHDDEVLVRDVRITHRSGGGSTVSPRATSSIGLLRARSGSWLCNAGPHGRRSGR
jgi:hypothetical protein